MPWTLSTLCTTQIAMWFDAGLVAWRARFCIIGPSGSRFVPHRTTTSEEACQIWTESVLGRHAATLEQPFNSFTLCDAASGMTLAYMRRMTRQQLQQQGMDSSVSAWILVWHSEEAKAMKPRTDDMSIEDQTAEEDGCNFFKRSASISRKSQVRDTLTSKSSRQMLVTRRADLQKSRRSDCPIADGTAPVSAGIGEKQLAKDRTNSTHPALPVAKHSVDSGGGKTSTNPKPQLIRPRGDQSDDQGQRPKKQIHSTQSRHKTSIEQQPTSNGIRDDDSGDRVQRPAKQRHSTEDRSKTQTTRKSNVAEDQRGQPGDNDQGANKHIPPVDASSKAQTTKTSEVARHRRKHPDNQDQRSKKQTHPGDTTTLPNAPSSVADQASTSMKGRRREPTLHSSSSSAKPRRIDGPDHLNADERRFIDEREHISIVGLYRSINRLRAAEDPPRPPLSNVWPVNWHRGRGRWHWDEGDPDMEKFNHWWKTRNW